MSWQRTVGIIKKRHKKRFGKSIKSNEIKKIWDSWLRKNVIEPLCRGGAVSIDRLSTIEIVGSPILSDRSFFGLLKKGKMLNNGRIVTAKLNQRRQDVKYKIVFKHSMKDIYFTACRDLKKEVRSTLNNTNNYFRINEH